MRLPFVRAISQRRNELLRQMYHMMQRRRNFGTILAVDEEEDEDLDVFLDKYDLQKRYVTFRVISLVLCP
jgi:chromatin modification-related protein VID21